MSVFRKLSLGQSLGLAFAIVVVLGVSGLVAARYYLNEIRSDVQLLTNVRIGNLLYVSQIKEGIQARSRMARDIVLEDDPARMTALMAEQEKTLKEITDNIDTLKRRAINAEGKAFVEALERARVPYRQSIDKALQFATQGKDSEATTVLLRELPPIQAAYFKVLHDMGQYQQDQATVVANRADASVAWSVALTTVLAALMAIVGVAVSVLITRSVVRKLGGEPAYAVQVAQHIAAGDLSVPVQLRAGDNDSLLANMEAMRQKLADIVSRVRQSSEAISTGANQISAGNTDLSQRTEEQAANLEETAASMEQMTSTVRQNADTVRTTADLAGKTSVSAEKGGAAVGDVVRTMAEISTSAQKIGDIIGIIDSIAFQTNILALNAAVEAARAGEQGRGFAVVASEVRTLAQRSASAAREIKGLVEESIAKVELGGQTVDNAGQLITEVVDQVRHVATLIGEIGTATVEQDQGISQVSLAVSQLDEVTQQNAALVEEAAAAADSLNSQAAEMVALVGVFRLSGQEGAPSSAQHVSQHVSQHISQHGARRIASPAPAHVPQRAQSAARPAATPATQSAAASTAPRKPMDRTSPAKTVAIAKPRQQPKTTDAVPRAAKSSNDQDDWDEF